MLRAALLLALLAPASLLAATYRAEIVSLRGTGLTVRIRERELILAADSHALYWRDRKPADRRAFAPGDPVWLRTRSAADGERLVELADPRTGSWLSAIRTRAVEGRVLRVEPARLTLAIDGGGEYTYALSSPLSLPEGLAPGDRVWVRATGRGETVRAETVSRTPVPPRPNEVEGEIDLLAPDGSEMTVRTDSGPLVVRIPASATIEISGEIAPATSLRPGMRVTLRFVRSGRGRRLHYLFAEEFPFALISAREGNILARSRVTMAPRGFPFASILAAERGAGFGRFSSSSCAYVPSDRTG